MNRTVAPESTRTIPVDAEAVEQTLEFLGSIVADMIRLQWLTAMRPSEICMIRPCDIDRSAVVWFYRPESHKTSHHSISRFIPIGKKGQEIIAKYLEREQEVYCFSPAEAEEENRAKRNRDRKTPANCGNGIGTNRKTKPKRKAGVHYDSNSYRRAVHRACDRAGICRWNPCQLRHLRATELRSLMDLESAQVLLGHQSKTTTEKYYAEPDLNAAIAIAESYG